MEDRIVKFRAWLKNDADTLEMTYNLAFEEYAPVNEQLASVHNLMQFTGLQDKNGKDIYEGDIVRLCVGSRHLIQNPFTVVYEFGSFQLRTAGQEWPIAFITYAQQCAENGRINHDSPEDVLAFIEIVGNVHENPEIPG